MERLLYKRLYQEHRLKEMRQVPDDQWDNEETIAKALNPEDASTPPQYLPRHMHALAYYTAAVCAKERTHVPMIGPSLDRRMITLLMRLCNSDTVHSLVCVACGQIHTCVNSWKRKWSESTWLSSNESLLPAIQYRSVASTLLKMMRVNKDVFSRSFELNRFLERFANDAHPDGNPFRNCQDFSRTVTNGNFAFRLQAS